MKRAFAPCATGLALLLGLSACTNPYDPAQRAIGGGLLGAGAGAAIGAAAGGGPGAAMGAAIGGATGVIAGVATHRRHTATTVTLATTGTPAITVITLTITTIAIIIIGSGGTDAGVIIDPDKDRTHLGAGLLLRPVRGPGRHQARSEFCARVGRSGGWNSV
jgi:hypothetical protein